MADKITVAEAVNLANQNTKDLTNEQLTQMNEAFAENFFNGEPRSAEVQMASDVTIAEIDARLDAFAGKQDLYDEKDLDSIIAMAESVGMFSQRADIAKAVLEKAQKQKADMAAAAQNIEVVEDRENQAQDTEQAEPQTAENQDESSITAATENKEDEDTLTGEDQQAIEVVENTPESQAELNKFDREAGIDKVTQEQLEKNDKIMDGIESPMAVNEQGRLKHPEFADELKALNNLTITDDKGNDLSKEDQNSIRADLIYAAQLEAETYARAAGNGNEADVQKLYYEHFKEALQRNIVSAAFASNVKKGMTQEQLQAKFAEAVNNPQKASITAVRAVTANSSAGATKIKDRIKAKFKSIPAVQKMEAKINAFDAAMTEKYGKKYQTAKRIAKAALRSIKNVAVYTAIGAMSGPAAPIAMAALAAKSAYDSTKALQAEAKKNNMSFWQYAKANKGKVALAFTVSGLSLAGAALGMGAGGQEMASKLRPALRTATRVLAVGGKAAPALVNTVKAGWKKLVKKDNEGAQADWAKAKEGWARTAEAFVGIVAGSMATEGFSEAKESVSASTNHETANTSTENQASPYVDNQMAPAEMAHTLEAMGLNPNVVEGMTPEAMQHYIDTHPEDYQAAQMMMQDKDDNVKTDVNDADHGQGWATANETQLDRLMDADPAKVNALLNDGEWHSSSELKEMMEHGQFSEEQLKAIHGLASREFDENGHIIDADLNAYYENMAREAAAREAAETAANEANEATADQTMGAQTLENAPVEEIEQEQVPQMTPEEQRAYEEILKIISKDENMADPEIRASVEGLAMGHLHEMQEMIARGDSIALATKIAELQNQDLVEATRANENDSRRLANAKEDVLEAKSKLDAAKEALAQDPNNEKLLKEVAKLEQKFDKESLDLEQREIKDERSELKDQIKQDEKTLKNREDRYENLEKAYGLSEEQVRQGLKDMGIDVHNLPQDTSTLPKEAQDLLRVQGLYTQAHQIDSVLQTRIQNNEQRLADLEKLEDQSKADEKGVKKGMGLSVEAQERLPGQKEINAQSGIIQSVVALQKSQGR